MNNNVISTIYRDSHVTCPSCDGAMVYGYNTMTESVCDTCTECGYAE